MMDVVDKKTRSRMMSGIRAKDTQPELKLRKALHRKGFRYRLHTKALPGKPDIVFPRYRTVCLVHGCFWHRHSDCRYTTTPSTRRDFWNEKFLKTVERDTRNILDLGELGYRIAIVWECEIKGPDFPKLLDALANWIVDAENRSDRFEWNPEPPGLNIDF